MDRLEMLHIWNWKKNSHGLCNFHLKGPNAVGFFILRWIQSCTICIIIHKYKTEGLILLECFAKFCKLLLFNCGRLFFLIFRLQTCICCEHLTFKCLIFHFVLLNVTVHIRILFFLIIGAKRKRSSLSCESVWSGSR